MKPLNEIESFPTTQRELLERKFGITSAEAFYEHARRSSEGMRTALQLTPEQLGKLMRLVEGHLTPEFVKRCQQPVTKHSRGAIVD